MNFLAHAMLAGNDPALIVGGVVGDWIKGPLPGLLPRDLARGVALHRAIDSHAETHPAFQRSRNRVAADRRRYAAIGAAISRWNSMLSVLGSIATSPAA
jgi:acyl carrier protein phosphodiesterase